jgi:hypothetical protein
MMRKDQLRRLEKLEAPCGAGASGAGADPALADLRNDEASRRCGALHSRREKLTADEKWELDALTAAMRFPPEALVPLCNKEAARRWGELYDKGEKRTSDEGRELADLSAIYKVAGHLPGSTWPREESPLTQALRKILGDR